MNLRDAPDNLGHHSELSKKKEIDVLITDKIRTKNRLEIQYNGRNIWEQTAKKLLRNYNTKQGKRNK